MKPLLILTALLFGLPVFGQSTWRNFFTTNQNPIVEVVAGSNATVQASTVGVNLRRFTVNSTATGGSSQTNWPLSSITNANNLTNWATLNTNVLSTLGQTNTSVASVTNAGTAAYSNASAFSLSGVPLTNLDTRQVSFRTSLEQTNATTGRSFLFTNGVATVTVSNGIVQTLTAIDLTNSAIAANNSQKYSPSFVMSGNGWETGGGTSKAVRFREYVIPVQGASLPTATWNLESSIDGSAFGGRLVVNSSGVITTGSGITMTASGGLTTSDDIQSAGHVRSSANFYWTSKAVMQSPVDGVIKFINNVGDNFTALIMGPTSNTFPTLVVSTNASGPLIDYTGILKTSGYMVKSNALSTWPTAPLARGDSFIGNSNGVVYALYSGLGLTWLKTNLISGP